MTRPAQPDFLIIGAPKAGTTALHTALAGHPDVFVSDPKEPKYWLCDGAPPPSWGGPGDRHSQQEWIWQADRYFRLFAPAAQHQDPVGGDVVEEVRELLAVPAQLAVAPERRPPGGHPLVL